MKVLIIIPVYNSSKSIEMCLDSCFVQSFEGELEVVAVNDGSKDNSGEVLNKYAQKERRLKVIHTTNQGVTMARRAAIQNATGDWLFFLDSDDFLPKDAIRLLVQKAKQDNAEIVIGDFAYLDTAHKLLYLKKNHILNDNVLYAALHFATTGNLCGRLIKKSVLDRIEWPSEKIKIGEDMICGLQLLVNSCKTVLLDKVVYNYIQYPNSTINSHHPTKVASMIPYLMWIDNYFDHTKTELRSDADYFILNEYFAYLMYGGKWGKYEVIKQIYGRCNKKELSNKIRIAYSPIGKFAIYLYNLIKLC